LRETFVLNPNNTYSSFAQFLKTGAGAATSTSAIGLAASNVNINSSYNIAGSNDVLTPGGTYLPGSIMDGLVQGTINVSCDNGTPTAGGSVFVRSALNGAIPNGVVGGLEAVADPNPITTTTFSTTAGSANATASTATGLAVGQILSGNVNVPAGTFIKSFVGTAVVLSQNVYSDRCYCGNYTLEHLPQSELPVEDRLP